jgi:DNA-binding NtrC family response regulator
MQSEHPVVLLVGSDPDVLGLRSVVLASAGIWSLRVQNADQAIAVLTKVACELVIICYRLDQQNQQQLLNFLLSSQSGAKSLWMLPSDDGSGTRFLMKVEDALEERPPIPSYLGNLQLAASLG